MNRRNRILQIEHAFSSSPLSTLAMADEIFAYLEQNTSMRLQQITFAGLKADYFAREKRNFPRVILTAKQKAMSDQKITTITAPFKTWLLAWITAENMAT